ALESARAALPRGEGAVLLVEDEADVREVAARMVVSLGYKVVETPDGEAAIEELRRSGDWIRVVLLDLTMPKLDGEETFRCLRAIRPDVPVVMMSGFSENELSSRFAGQGVAGFLAKPFTLETLAERLRMAIDEGRVPAAGT